LTEDLEERPPKRARLRESALGKICNSLERVARLTSNPNDKQQLKVQSSAIWSRGEEKRFVKNCQKECDRLCKKSAKEWNLRVAQYEVDAEDMKWKPHKEIFEREIKKDADEKKAELEQLLSGLGDLWEELDHY
jgi:uncharacterized protein YeaO (DUF488 family)